MCGSTAYPEEAEIFTPKNRSGEIRDEAPVDRSKFFPGMSSSELGVGLLTPEQRSQEEKDPAAGLPINLDPRHSSTTGARTGTLDQHEEALSATLASAGLEVAPVSFGHDTAGGRVHCSSTIQLDGPVVARLPRNRGSRRPSGVSGYSVPLHEAFHPTA